MSRFLSEFLYFSIKIVTIGSGIRKMFEYQRQRFFPMPEYTFQNKRVELRILGKILDVKFAKTLALNPDLDLRAILMLDKVQKNKPINEESIKNLRKQGLIEGRKPNFYLAAKTVKPLTDELKIQYIKQKGFDDEHYKKMILEYLSKFGSANRNIIETLLVNKLPDILSASQKKNKITNLLTALRLEHKIINVGSDHKSLWTLKEL